jgi:RNA ligase (TIGR02306 family)
MRNLATIRIINNIQPIKDADVIERAVVDGWNVVVKKGEHRVGELVIYCEIDSFISEDIAPFLSRGGVAKEYNGVVGNRLRTIKFRGVVSQGLILPISTLSKVGMHYDDWIGLKEGDDVTYLLGIQKYIPPIPVELSGVVKGKFPSFINKSDSERIQNLIQYFDNEWILDSHVEVTLKLDGSSCTIYYKDGEVGVCSRNWEFELTDDNKNNSFIRAAINCRILEVLKQAKRNIAIQSELIGPGVQCNREKLKEHTLFVYNVFDIDKQSYMTPIERYGIIQAFNRIGSTIEHVPVIACGTTLRDLGLTTLDKMLEYVDRPSMNHSIAEGCVFKTYSGVQFKCINNNFLLKFGE